MMETFGALLSRYRRRCADPQRGGMLTQERLAELLEQEAGISGYSAIRVSNWERGQEVIRQDNRQLLVGLVTILHWHGGFHTLDEANAFLFAGGYRNLNEEETRQVNSHWLESSGALQETTNVPELKTKIDLSDGRSFTATMLDWLRLRLNKQPLPGRATANLHLYSPTCGDEGIDLGHQRLLISTTFGAYFTGLLERPQSYIELQDQISAPNPPGQERASPLERMFWALQQPKGPRLLVIAAEGGMGKSTLAAKIIRCLFQEQAVDLILGDSAKNRQVNVITGTVAPLEPGYYDIASYYERLCSQLGLPYKPSQSNDRQLINSICDRLVGRRALIILDNLETLEQGTELLQTLRRITGRDIRAIVTTRTVNGLHTYSSEMMVVHLRPIRAIESVQTFLAWHIRHYQDEYPRLGDLSQDLAHRKRIQQLIERTGGLPLLIQLLLSDVARNSWAYLDHLPHLFGYSLLNFLYQSRWEELGNGGQAGMMGRQLLQWVAGEQYRGRKVSLERLVQWSQSQTQAELLAEALQRLHERFLIVNQDPVQGNFTLFPSLVEFLQRQS